jgi:hypothetical protein
MGKFVHISIGNFCRFATKEDFQASAFALTEHNVNILFVFLASFCIPERSHNHRLTSLLLLSLLLFLLLLPLLLRLLLLLLLSLLLLPLLFLLLPLILRLPLLQICLDLFIYVFQPLLGRLQL